jgi:hypothetical protein
VKYTCFTIFFLLIAFAASAEPKHAALQQPGISYLCAAFRKEQIFDKTCACNQVKAHTWKKALLRKRKGIELPAVIAQFAQTISFEALSQVCATPVTAMSCFNKFQVSGRGPPIHLR